MKVWHVRYLHPGLRLQPILSLFRIYRYEVCLNGYGHRRYFSSCCSIQRKGAQFNMILRFLFNVFRVSLDSMDGS